MTDETRPRLELFLRTLAPTTGREHQERIVERVQTIDEENVIRHFDVVLCGECVCPQSVTANTTPGKQLLRRYEAFTDWTAETGRDLVGFEERETDSLLTGTTVTGIVFPRIVLAEYRGGSLTFVSPSGTDDTKTTVADRLSAYESGDIVERSSSQEGRGDSGVS